MDGSVDDEQSSADQPQLKPSIVLTGTAKEGSAGPPVGLVDIGESENAYLFRLALPGVRKDQSELVPYKQSLNGFYFIFPLLESF